MTDQVAVLESIRDVLSGKVAAPTENKTSPEDEDEIMDLTKLVNDDGSITDLADLENLEPEKTEEMNMANVSTTAGDDVLGEIDKLLADDVTDDDSGFAAIEADEPIESITDETIELELTEETIVEETIEEISFDAIEPEPVSEPEPTTQAEEIMTNDEPLVSEDAANKAKSAIADLLKVTGKEKAAPAPHTPSPSFRNGDTVEDLVMESLKPMLKKWLDENLNSLVEEIVQKEISRIIPK